MLKYLYTISDISVINEIGKFIVTEGKPTVRIIRNGEVVFIHEFEAFYPVAISLNNTNIKLLAHPYLYSINVSNYDFDEVIHIPQNHGLHLMIDENLLVSKKNSDKSRDVSLFSKETKENIWTLHNFDLLSIYTCKAVLISTGWFSKNTITAIDVQTGKISWRKHFIPESMQIQLIRFYENQVIVQVTNIVSALNVFTGELIWNKPIAISAFDEKNGLIYFLSNHYVVIDAATGDEVIRVDNWTSNQIDQYPALKFRQMGAYLADEYLVFVSRTQEDKIEGGVFFIDKTTAEVKEYFRIVFDKDPVVRKDWDGKKIPDDQQIPFIPLETPIYKDGRLYVVLPSPVEGQKDLYIYECEE